MELPTTSNQNFDKVIKEGDAEIVIKTDKAYNPFHKLNRDLSVAVLNIFTNDYKVEKIAKLERSSKRQTRYPTNYGDVKNENCSKIDVTILEAVSTTGLKSIRYAKEVQNVTKIIANDKSKDAVDIIKANIIHNELENIIETSHSDARSLMYKHTKATKRFTVIELDPYGSPSKFLDAAVQSIQSGGLLLVTTTDLALLTGMAKESCYFKYASICLPTGCYREMAIRILLQSINQHASRYKRYIEPLLSISRDSYIILFIKICAGPIKCNKLMSKLSMVYHCDSCDNIMLQPMGTLIRKVTMKNRREEYSYRVSTIAKYCIHCSKEYYMGGPIWSAPIHDVHFVSRVLAYVESNFNSFDTTRQIQGLLSMVMEELQNIPLYYTMDKLFRRVFVDIMPMLTMRSAILNAGYVVSYSHMSKTSIKTNAPAQLIWDIIRTWAQTHPPDLTLLEQNSIAKHILNQEIQNTVNLSKHKDANPRSRRLKRLRFPPKQAQNEKPGISADIKFEPNSIAKHILNQEIQNTVNLSEHKDPRRRQLNRPRFQPKRARN